MTTAADYLLAEIAADEAEYVAIGSDTMWGEFGQLSCAVRVLWVEVLRNLPLGLGLPLLARRARREGWPR